MNIDWQRIEAFVRVADAGSLTHAARQMQISQPTLSRHVQELEDQLGVALFVRHVRGLTLTDRGAELLGAARDVHDRVDVFVRQATGLRSDPSGIVRISVDETLGVFVLGPHFAALRQQHPRIALEVVVDTSSANLSRREADIAVRMYRPHQPDLVARQIVDSLAIGLFASESYVESYGAPTEMTDIHRHTLIGFDRDQYWYETIGKMGLRPEQFSFRTDSVAAQIEAIRHGVGIGALHLSLALQLERLVRVMPALPIDPLEIWLVVHRDVRDNPAVRAVLDALAPALRGYAEIAANPQ
jgi:DNA-binding transcriptional LysR family regulator